MFKSHLEMIGRNETPSKKAKFWQSYIRSLKGSEDIRAHETPRASRPYSSYLDAPSAYRSIYEEPATTAERVQSSGYRYLPVSRDTYGYSPRAIYDHHYSRTIPANYEAEKAWNDHLKRMQEIERKYPSRWGLYLREKPSASNPLVPLEYEPEDKLLTELNKGLHEPVPVPSRWKRAGSEPYVPAPTYWSKNRNAPSQERATTVAPFERAGSVFPTFARPIFRASSLEPLDELLASKFGNEQGENAPVETAAVNGSVAGEPAVAQPQQRATSLAPQSSTTKPARNLGIFERAGSPTPTPVKAHLWAPRPHEVAYDADGRPLLFPRNRLRDMLEPNPNAPISSFIRDPFWWDVDDLAPIRSLSVPRGSSPIARDSFLSPVKNRYLWGRHPARPLTPHRTIF